MPTRLTTVTAMRVVTSTVTVGLRAGALWLGGDQLGRGLSGLLFVECLLGLCVSP